MNDNGDLYQSSDTGDREKFSDSGFILDVESLLTVVRLIVWNEEEGRIQDDF